MTSKKYNKDQLLEKFDVLDEDGDGQISIDELKGLMKKCGCSVTDIQLQDLINYADITPDGMISDEGFVKIYNIYTSEGDSMDDLEEAFKIFDKDGSGLLTPEKILKIFKKIDGDIKEEEVLQLIKENDLDGDGKLNFDEFCKMVKNK